MARNVKRALQVSALLVVAVAFLATAVADGEFGGWGGALYVARLRYLHHVPPLTWPREPFSPEEWKHSEVGSRYRFAKSLLADQTQIGRTVGDVGRILGGNIPANAERWHYPLKRCEFQNLWWVLVVEFQNGRVASVRRDTAWLDP